MANFEEIIKKYADGDGNIPASAIPALTTAISTAVGNGFVTKERYKTKLEEIETLKEQKQTAEDNAGTAESWKQKYENEAAAHKATKESHQKEANAGKVKAAVEAYLKSNGVQEKHLKHAMRYASDLLDGIKLDGEKITDTSSLDALLKGDAADFVTTTTTGGTNPPAKPPQAGGGSANPTAAQIAANFHTNRYGKE